MNKKAAIILLSASLAFIISSIMLLNTHLKTGYVMGDSQMAMIGIHKEAEIYLMYIDTAAKFSLADTIKQKKDSYDLCSKGKQEACNELSKHFRNIFKKHITSFNKVYAQNIDVNNYEFKFEFRISGDEVIVGLTGISKDNIIIKIGEKIRYKVKPSFKILVNLAELDELATTPKTIAISFFNDLVNKFKKCPEKNSGKNCICEDTEINPNELPDDYRIKITTEATKEALAKSAKYKFELLYNNEVVASRELMGKFGAFEFVKTDIDNKICYPGIIPKERVYLGIEKGAEKGKLYFSVRDANCKGVSKFSMVEFVKESNFGELTITKCKEIGVKMEEEFMIGIP